MVSHPETGSDSPIGSNRDRGRDILHLYVTQRASWKSEQDTVIVWVHATNILNN